MSGLEVDYHWYGSLDLAHRYVFSNKFAIVWYYLNPKTSDGLRIEPKNCNYLLTHPQNAQKSAKKNLHMGINAVVGRVYLQFG